jgi:hypothetical protein
MALFSKCPAPTEPRVYKQIKSKIGLRGQPRSGNVVLKAVSLVANALLEYFCFQVSLCAVC